MKNLIYSIAFLTVGLIPFSATSQNHWVQTESVNWGTSPRFLNEGNGNYSLVQAVGTGLGQMRVEEKSASALNWSLLNTDATSGYNVSNYNQMSYFMYNGLRTVAYDNGTDIQINQWDAGNNNFSTLTSFTPTNLGTFSVAINPTTNNIYIAHTNGTTNCVDVSFYNGTVWSTPIMQLAPSPGVYSYLNPKIHFNGDTLFLAGISAESPAKLAVYKQHFNNLGTMIPVSISANSQNVNSYAMCGEAGQDPYFVGYSSTTNNLNLSSITNNTISELGTATIGNFPGGVGLDMTINNGVIEVVGVTDDGNGSGDIVPFKWDGSTFGPIISSSVYSYVTGSSVAHQTINQTNNGRTFLTFDTGLMGDGYFYATNNPPTVPSNTPNDLCVYSNSTVIFDNLIFNDLDGDSIVITDIQSSNSSLINSGIGNFILNAKPSTPTSNAYEIEYYNSVGYVDTVSLTIYYTDGYDPSAFTVNIIINPQPTFTPVASEIIVCNNVSEVDLNPYSSTNPYPGVWIFGYDIIPNGIFYPFSGLNPQENPPLEFEYTDQTTGCSNYNSFQLAFYDAPLVSLAINDADCGNSNGMAQITTISGYPGYTISWSTGEQDTSTIYNLASGQYFTTVIDTHECHTTVPVNIGINGVNVTSTIGNIDCNGENNGFIHLNVTGPDAPYTYLWSNGKSTLNIDNLVAGTYDVVITSSTGCQTSETFVVSQPDKITFPDNYYTDGSSCGNADGVIYVDFITGGTGSTYTFSWDNGVTTQNNTNIAAGVYNLVVTDSIGCTAQLNCTLGDYDAPYVEADTITQPSCNLSNGKIVLGLYSGDPVQDILWSNGSTTPTISNLTAGHYSCTVTTTTGCKSYGEFELTTKAPMQNNICLLTVDSATTTNLVVWEKVETNVDHYNIYREGSSSGQYMLIDTVSGLNHSIFNDVVASPKTRSWRYKISAVNQCGIESQLSIHHKTVHLVISQSIGTQYNIVWDEYEGFDYSTVNLWRYTNQNGWEMISALPSNIYSYTDDLLSIDPAGIDYMIEVAPQTPCSPDKAQDYNSSRSNKANSIMVVGAGTGASNNSIDEYGNPLSMLIYPNPTTGILNLVWEGETTEYQILDIQGKIISQSTINTGKSTIDLSNVVPGIYFIKINGSTNKIIIQ